MKVLNLSRSSTCSNIRRNNGDSRNFDWLYVVFSRRHCRLSRRLHSHQQSSRMRFQNIPMRSNAILIRNTRTPTTQVVCAQDQLRQQVRLQEGLNCFLRIPPTPYASRKPRLGGHGELARCQQTR